MRHSLYHTSDLKTSFEVLYFAAREVKAAFHEMLRSRFRYKYRGCDRTDRLKSANVPALLSTTQSPDSKERKGRHGFFVRNLFPKSSRTFPQSQLIVADLPSFPDSLRRYLRSEGRVVTSTYRQKMSNMDLLKGHTRIAVAAKHEQGCKVPS